MIKKITQFLKRLFFVHPVIDKKLDSAIEHKIAKTKKETDNKIEAHQQVLNSFLKTYFTKKYSDSNEMALAFETTKKLWIKHCREVNSKERNLNLKKDAFEIQVKKVIQKLKENELHSK